MSPGHAPNAVRLALGAPSTEQLDLALRTLSGMLTARKKISIRPNRSIGRTFHLTGHSAIKPFALYGSILSHSCEHAAAEFGVGVPERPRRPQSCRP